MTANRYRGPPMTLVNMRANGVRSLAVTCELCHHRAVLNLDGFDGTVPVPSFRPRMVSAVSGEPHSVPAHDRLGPDDGYGVQDARKAAI